MSIRSHPSTSHPFHTSLLRFHDFYTLHSNTLSGPKLGMALASLPMRFRAPLRPTLLDHLWATVPRSFHQVSFSLGVYSIGFLPRSLSVVVPNLRHPCSSRRAHSGRQHEGRSSTCSRPGPRLPCPPSSLAARDNSFRREGTELIGPVARQPRTL